MTNAMMDITTKKATRLIIARHGNTFEKGEIVRRVGMRTDLDLTEEGRAQGRAIGRYLKAHDLLPDHVFSSQLKRTQQTAQESLSEAALERAVQPLSLFNEIDYGPDENKSEDEVIARIGEDAIKEWDKSATVPQGWDVDIETITTGWQFFASDVATRHQGETIMVVTSNGIARFAPFIIYNNMSEFTATHPLKIATGAVCVLECHDQTWSVKSWNVRPDL
jgi:probable phosphoglycerate mutase